MISFDPEHLLCCAGVAELFYILVLLQVLLGSYAVWEGVQWLRLARRSLTSHPGFYAPRVALICPCKGVETALELNLSALTTFDYPNYEIFFALAATDDPAYETVRRVVAGSKKKAHIVVAGLPRERGEKVNNIWAAVEQLSPDFEVLVFTDSDGRPAHHWLHHLVAPLGDGRFGAATTFRWLLPGHGGFASALGAAWNASIATSLAQPGRNFCWGGGTAIRRKVFDECRVLDYWMGSVSDDYSMTRALEHARRRIHFVPECLVPSVHESDFRGLLEFTNRQMVITHVYAPRLWMLTALSHFLYCLTLVLGIGLLLSSWMTGAPGLHYLMLASLAPLLAAAKGYLRMVAVTELLANWKEKILQLGWAWTVLAALVPFLFLANCLVAAFTRRIVWRGIRYELVSPTQTRILSL